MFGVLPIPMSRAPYLAVFARTRPMDIEDIRSAILGRLLGFAHEPMSPEELRRAKARAINLHVLPLDSPRVPATLLNREYLITGKTTGCDAFVRRINAVSAEDVLEFAQEQLTRHAIGVVLPGT